MWSERIARYLEKHTWPFIFSERILKKIHYKTPAKGYVLFETGYGPSGLPHIGTFGENLRTGIVRHAFLQMTIFSIPTRLFCVSDDIDGLRKIPEFIKDKDALRAFLDKPLSDIPDPFGKTSSFAEHMNGIMKDFLSRFGFDYEFISASEYYRTGQFNEGLRRVMDHYEAIMEVMLPTLGEERQRTYSPFLPICPKSGRVLQVPVTKLDKQNYTISYRDPATAEEITVSVLDGACKLQWKPDFAMRWNLFDVDFEMYGKDHLVNGRIYSSICSILGSTPPHQEFYELFLDAEGKKISKSKDSGASPTSVTLDKWLRYAPLESVSMFMYQSPQRAKKLTLDVIPKMVDEYLVFLEKYHSAIKRGEDQYLLAQNPVWHIHNGNPPSYETDISYSLLLNLVMACGIEESSVIWRFIDRMRNINEAASTGITEASLVSKATEIDADVSANSYADLSTRHSLAKDDAIDNIEVTDVRATLSNPQIPDAKRCSFMQSMIDGAINYYRDFVVRTKKYRKPTEHEAKMLRDLIQSLRKFESLERQDKDNSCSADKLQSAVYQIAKDNDVEMKEWFSALYQILLGAESGPRFGSFIKLYSLPSTIELIESKLAAEEVISI